MVAESPVQPIVLPAITRYAEQVVAGEIVAGKPVRLAAERHLRDVETGPLRGLRFNEERAQRAVTFIQNLRHSKGEWAGQLLTLADWQLFVVGSVFGWVRADGTRRFREVYTEIARKNGKALALDTPIPTPDGWTTMGALSVGDSVFDEHGQPCQVIAATEVMHDRPCYEVEFSDGEKIVADAEHLWQTEARRTGGTQGKRRLPEDDLRTTRQIAESLTVDSPYNRQHGRTEWNHRIPVAAPLSCPPADLPIAPYVLGAWLGDGHTAAALITTVDQEILTAIESAGVAVRPYAGRISYGLGDGNRRAARGTSVQARLRAIGVLNNKHIPNAYQRASIQQRMALLRGLMDTDGYVSRAGQCEFVTINERLYGDVLELLRGLGFKPTATIDRAKIDGRDCGPRYRIQFWSYADRPVFGLARKRVRLKEPPKRRTRAAVRQIVRCDPVVSVPVRCIQVDSPSRLYLAGRGMIPTHNSTLLAAVGLYLTCADDEPGAEVYAVATKEDQARIMWSEAARMAKQTPALMKRLVILESQNNASIAWAARNSSFVPLARSNDTQSGLNPHGALVDELHEHKTRNMVDILETAQGARRQPLIWYITTAGHDQSSIWWEKRSYALMVVEGAVEDDSVFVYLATLDDDDDWTDEAVWAKANPNLGISKKIDKLREDCAKAEAQPSRQNAFLRYEMNVPTEQAERWIDMGQWDACGEQPTVAAGARGFAALDMASTIDLSAAVAVFPQPDGSYDVLCRFWRPEETVLEAEQRDHVPYRLWAEQGYLQLTEGSMMLDTDIAADMLAWLTPYQIEEYPFDSWNARGAGALIEKRGGTAVAMAQGYQTYSGPCNLLEGLLQAGKLRHGNHPILRWMAGQAMILAGPNNAKRPYKPKGSGIRDDGIVALLMALARAMVHQQAEAKEPRSWSWAELPR